MIDGPTGDTKCVNHAMANLAPMACGARDEVLIRSIITRQTQIDDGIYLYPMHPGNTYVFICIYTLDV